MRVYWVQCAVSVAAFGKSWHGLARQGQARQARQGVARRGSDVQRGGFPALMRDNGEVVMTKEELDAIPLAPDSMRFCARWLEDSDPDGVTEPDGTEWKFLRIDGVLHKRPYPY